MKKLSTWLALPLAALAFVFGLSMPGHAQVSFKGQTVSLIINSNAGGVPIHTNGTATMQSTCFFRASESEGVDGRAKPGHEDLK